MDYFILLQLLPLLAFIYFYFYRPKLNHWPSRGIKGPTPLPFVYNFLEQAWKGQIVCEMEWVEKYGKVYGSFQSSEPALSISDHELIKQVLVKDFNLFVNRRKVRGFDEVWCRNLFNLEGDDWKRVRTITSPTFTSGKLRGMNNLMSRCVEKMNNYLEKLIEDGGVLKTKEVISGFTIDVIASTSFATDTNANDDRSKANSFVYHGMNLLQIPFSRLLAFLLVPAKLRPFFGMKTTFLPEHFNFFLDLARQVVKERKQSGRVGKRNDLVQLLMDANVTEKDLKSSNYHQLTANNDDSEEDAVQQVDSDHKGLAQHKATGKALSENEIIAQCILFFIAGFETTATTLTFCLFELAFNPEVQQRLCDEITSAVDGLKPDTNEYYEAVYKIEYLEATIKETLRKYPPVIRLERRVNVDGYKLAGVTLHKEDLVNIPTYAVHHNPDYYPEPERFNPERFLPENKHLLVPYTYLPFGQGPRNCVGMRFAYQEIKLLLAQMLPRFQFTPRPDTPHTLKFVRVGLLSTKPFELAVTKRV